MLPLPSVQEKIAVIQLRDTVRELLNVEVSIELDNQRATGKLIEQRQDTEMIPAQPQQWMTEKPTSEELDCRGVPVRQPFRRVEIDFFQTDLLQLLAGARLAFVFHQFSDDIAEPLCPGSCPCTSEGIERKDDNIRWA